MYPLFYIINFNTISKLNLIKGGTCIEQFFVIKLKCILKKQNPTTIVIGHRIN